MKIWQQILIWVLGIAIADFLWRLLRWAWDGTPICQRAADSKTEKKALEAAAKAKA